MFKITKDSSQKILTGEMKALIDYKVLEKFGNHLMTLEGDSDERQKFLVVLKNKHATIGKRLRFAFDEVCYDYEEDEIKGPLSDLEWGYVLYIMGTDIVDMFNIIKRTKYG